MNLYGIGNKVVQKTSKYITKIRRIPTPKLATIEAVTPKSTGFIKSTESAAPKTLQRFLDEKLGKFDTYKADFFY